MKAEISLDELSSQKNEATNQIVRFHFMNYSTVRGFVSRFSQGIYKYGLGNRGCATVDISCSTERH